MIYHNVESPSVPQQKKTIYFMDESKFWRHDKNWDIKVFEVLYYVFSESQLYIFIGEP